MNDQQKHATFTAMSRYGGGFATALAQAWFVADPYNRETIEKNWPDLVREYRDVATARGEMPK